MVVGLHPPMQPSRLAVSRCAQGRTVAAEAARAHRPLPPSSAKSNDIASGKHATRLTRSVAPASSRADGRRTAAPRARVSPRRMRAPPAAAAAPRLRRLGFPSKGSLDASLDGSWRHRTSPGQWQERAAPPDVLCRPHARSSSAAAAAPFRLLDKCCCIDSNLPLAIEPSPGHPALRI
jgi:hypothetical protein